MSARGCAHSQQGSLTVPWLWAEQYSHVIFLRSFIRNYLYLVMSQYSYAFLIERSNLQNKENTMQLQFSNGSRELLSVVMDQLLTTHFMSKCYTVLFHLWTLSGLQKNWWGLAWMSSQLRIIGSIQQQHDRVRGLGSTLQFEIITTPQVRVFTLWLIKISKNLNCTILLDTSQNWSSNMSICDLNEKKNCFFWLQFTPKSCPVKETLQIIHCS